VPDTANQVITEGMRSAKNFSGCKIRAGMQSYSAGSQFPPPSLPVCLGTALHVHTSVSLAWLIAFPGDCCRSITKRACLSHAKAPCSAYTHATTVAGMNTSCQAAAQVSNARSPSQHALLSQELVIQPPMSLQSRQSNHHIPGAQPTFSTACVSNSHTIQHYAGPIWPQRTSIT